MGCNDHEANTEAARVREALTRLRLPPVPDKRSLTSVQFAVYCAHHDTETPMDKDTRNALIVVAAMVFGAPAVDYLLTLAGC